MRTEEFIKLVRSKYSKDPFYISGFAFWKIEDQILRADIFQLKRAEIGECLYAIINQKLVFYWADHDGPFMIPLEELRAYKLISLHSRFEEMIGNLSDSHNIKSYAPLSYEGAVRNEKTNHNFRVVTIAKNRHHLPVITEIINESTKGNLTGESIEAWTNSRVYAPDLWIGAVEKTTNNLVGVGISTYNVDVQETDLDWFYVRKDYQGCGVGRMLVQETISRSRNKSRVIRVAGVADGFYTKCGFVQKDTWYYLTRKSTKVEWWD